MIGAITRIVQPASTSIWTCCTSLVFRVMSDGAPKVPTSRAENVPTRSSSAPRRSRPAAIAACAPQYTPPIEQAICTAEIASMSDPVDRM